MNTAPATLPSPLAVVQQAYADFHHGNLPALLARLHPAVAWSTNVDPALPGVDRVPCYAAGSGRDFVAAYLQRFAENYAVQEFSIRSFLTGGAEVAACLQVDLVVRRTGRRVRSQVIHLWTVNEAGEITRFLDVEDTHAFVQAWAP